VLSASYFTRGLMISIIVLLSVFLLIAVRQIGRVKLKIWQIMLGGALVVLLTGQIAPAQALHAINADVMLFLFGVFLIGQAMEDSGYLAHLAYRLFGRARTLNGLVLAVLFGAGLLSAVLLNDTLAIIGTPVVIALAGRAKAQPKILLLALAFAVTIGSVMSPIGNPQNLSTLSFTSNPLEPGAGLLYAAAFLP
jgi:Na+/H+ antiporter NhaD/arsenite permease-like protein